MSGHAHQRIGRSQKRHLVLFDLGPPGQVLGAVERPLAASLQDAHRRLSLQPHNHPQPQLHEMVLGTPQELRQHAELMKMFPTMEHADANMAHVKPGARGEIVWQFTQAGEYQFACLIPGHFEAGMTGKVAVK